MIAYGEWEQLVENVKETWRAKVDSNFLATTLERRCKACGGQGRVDEFAPYTGSAWDIKVGTKKCPTCHGSKTEQITIGEIIKQWEEGK
jgi:DnaJ-class molecular chaperone